MKKFPLFLISIFILFACEDVIQVDTPSEEPRLIVDALVRLDSTQQFHTVRVKVNLTDSFFGESPVTSLEEITLTNVEIPGTFENPSTVILLESEPGIYERGVSTSFLTEGELILQLTHEGQRYLARTSYIETVPIISLRQGTGTLFDGDETEVIVRFEDDGDREDFYLFDFDFGEYLVTEDEFYQGQEFEFSFFYDNNLTPGQEVSISILGVDQSFYNYMDQLIEQGGDIGGPFQTPAATVRGNIINVTNIDNMDIFDNVDQPDNFALGYFAICQTFSQTIIIE